jgi:hypothetical protein
VWGRRTNRGALALTRDVDGMYWKKECEEWLLTPSRKGRGAEFEYGINKGVSSEWMLGL